MTLKGILHYTKQFLRGDVFDRQSVLYYLDSKMRRLDLAPCRLEAHGTGESCFHRYSDSGGPRLAEVLRSLSISPSDSAIDIGCGKGGAMTTMAEFPFSRVDGLEICPELVTIAERNLARAGFSRGQVFCGDASQFEHYADYTLLYLYNPFSESVMGPVVDKITQALKSRSTPMTIVYYNPVCDSLLLRAGCRRISSYRYGPLAIYVYSLSPTSDNSDGQTSSSTHLRLVKRANWRCTQ